LKTKRFGTALFVSLAILIASFNSIQARINGELGFRMGDGFASALISISGGLLLIVTALAFSPVGRSGLAQVPKALKERRLVWWHLLGGVSGAFYAVAQTQTGLILGVALFSIAIVSGQTLSSLIMDRLGVGPSGKHHITWPRMLGTILVLLAVILSVSGQLNAEAPIWVAWMPFVAGFGMGWQLAVNGRVRAQTASVLAATFINFFTAATLLTLIVVIRGFTIGWPSGVPSEPWLFAGGILGSLFIAGSAFVVARIGVLVLGVSVVAGQLIGALVIDLVSPSPLHPLTSATVLGVVLSLVAVVISTVDPKIFPRKTNVS
jgi:bacterial/archaeal transporter family-2 protein